MTIHVGDWMRLHCGDRVYDVEDPRHVGRVEAIHHCEIVTVKWDDTAWISHLRIDDVRQVPQLDFGFGRQGVGWTAFRCHGANRSHYAMTVDGEATAIWVRWCGHPTALRPYYVELPGGSILDRKFRTVEQAKAAAIAEWEAMS